LDCISIGVSLYLLIQVLNSKSKNDFRSCTVTYLLSVFVLFILSGIVVYLFDTFTSIKYIEVLNMWFNCVETYVLLNFFKQIQPSIIDSKFISKASIGLIFIFLLLSIYLITRIKPSPEIIKYSKGLMVKIGETTDIIKRLIICIPCMLYFNKIFKSNSPFDLIPVLVVFAIFSYCILGSLTYSIGFNLTYYRELKRLILTLPIISLWFVCISLLFYIKQDNCSIYAGDFNSSFKNPD
jgi:hypothetical protein